MKNIGSGGGSKKNNSGCLSMIIMVVDVGAILISAIKL